MNIYVGNLPYGATEEELKTRGIPYCTGSYPFSDAGRARCMGETDGFVKLLAHQRTDRILGVHIIGPHATDLLGEGALAVAERVRSARANGRPVILMMGAMASVMEKLSRRSTGRSSTLSNIPRYCSLQKFGVESLR